MDLDGVLKLLVYVLVTVMCCFGVVQCSNWDDARPSTIAARAAEAAQEKANETPHIIRRSPDGCAVYAFKLDDHYHLFTRCSSGTSTDNSWEVSHGKTHETVNETIETQGH